jgi:phytoene desaturase
VKSILVIGSGFSGLAAASFLAKAGYQVTVVEKHNMPGGRARQYKQDGFTFDMGPSWYWMPDVFDRYFASFGKKTSDYYTLERLDPSYRIFWEDRFTDIPADYDALKKLFESLEPGSGAALDQFLKEAAYKYQVGIQKLVFKPGQSVLEFLDVDLIKGVFKLDVFTSIRKHIQRHFKHPYLRQLLEFPVLFLGALPQDTPALYSLMNYADIKLGTWYPKQGMYQVVQGMYQVASELGVQFLWEHEVTAIQTTKGIATGITCNTANGQVSLKADVVVGSADYAHIDQKLLAPADRTYTPAYWDKRVMAPSCLIYYVGLNKKLKQILHHTLFFDVDFEAHGADIYTLEQWPREPLFYVSAPSATDSTVAPVGCENLFFLIPVAAGLEGDTTELRDKYFEQILKRFEAKIGEPVREHIILKRSYSVSNFVDDYHSFKGNAYGLANTLMQTAILKPSMHSKKVRNLFFTGQLTVPGPGVPPSLISGEVVAKEISRYLQNK